MTPTPSSFLLAVGIFCLALSLLCREPKVSRSFLISYIGYAKEEGNVREIGTGHVILSDPVFDNGIVSSTLTSVKKVEPEVDSLTIMSISEIPTNP
jgi:hypothetical protein